MMPVVRVMGVMMVMSTTWVDLDVDSRPGWRNNNGRVPRRRLHDNRPRIGRLLLRRRIDRDVIRLLRLLWMTSNDAKTKQSEHANCD